MTAHTLLPTVASDRRARYRQRAGGGAYPFVSEEQFDRRIQRHADMPLTDLSAGLPTQTMRYLWETAMLETMEALGLSPFERRVLELRVDAAPIREIAARTGVPKYQVESALRHIRRLFKHRRDQACGGWQDVYLSETRRLGK